MDQNKIKFENFMKGLRAYVKENNPEGYSFITLVTGVESAEDETRSQGVSINASHSEIKEMIYHLLFVQPKAGMPIVEGVMDFLDSSLDLRGTLKEGPFKNINLN